MKRISQLISLALGLALLGIITACSNQNATPAEQTTPPTPSPYRDLLDSEIRGLADQTIEEYLTGKGMGLALPAELNGYPGPRHLLDLADDLDLTSEQTAQIQALFDEMQPQAIALGKDILTAEATLEEDFRQQTIDNNSLESQLQTIATLQAQLRFVHLNTHLATVEILSPHQITLYNSLRGYSDMPMDHNQHRHSNG